MVSSSDGVDVPGFYAYDYDELPDQSHIRLFELFPGKPEDPVQGRLLTGSIAQVPLYESISYVWGDQTDICAIICAGRALRITRSLHEALRIVRPAQGSRSGLLWADALCINQANPQERGNQVQLMRSIYALAARVLVWLGRDDTGKAHEAIGALERIAGTWGTSHIVRLCQVLDPAVFHSIRGLLERPWFDRVWILQEIGVASSAVFFCGEAMISWTDLYIACQNLRQCGAEAGPQRQADVRKVLRIFEFFQFNAPRYSIRFNVFHLLNETRSSLASDPRDKVYALLGHPLFKDTRGREFIPVDYTLTRDEVYAKVAMRLLQEPLGLSQLFSYVQHDHQTLTEQTASSWVPRWDVKSTTEILGARTDFSAGFNVPDRTVLREEGQTTCNTSGLIVDYITWTSGEFKSEDFPGMFQKATMPKSLEEVLTTIGRSCVFPQPVLRRLSHQSILFENLAHALCAGFKGLHCSMLDGLAQYVINTFENGEFLMRTHFPDILTMQKYDPRLIEQMRAWCNNRRFFMTKQGYFGLGPKVIAGEDLVAVLHGVNVPYVIRRQGDSSHELCGECFMLGIMNGKLLLGAWNHKSSASHEI